MKRKTYKVDRRDFLRKATSAALASAIIPGQIVCTSTSGDPDGNHDVKTPNLNPIADPEKLKVQLIKIPVNFGSAMENSPFIFENRRG